MGGLDRRWALTVWALFEAQVFFWYTWAIPSWFLLSFEELAVLLAGICFLGSTPIYKSLKRDDAQSRIAKFLFSIFILDSVPVCCYETTKFLY